MKKIKLVLAALTLMSSLAFANFKDVPKTHWSYQAVTDLYNKGLLAPTVTDAEAFKGDGVFSRYEIASMLYYNVVYMDEKFESKASVGDVIALKALVADFAPELAKMGADVKGMDTKLEEALGKLETKINRKLSNLQDRVNKVKVSGDFTSELEVGMKDNAPGMGDGLDYEGSISIVGNISKNISAVTKMSIEEGEDIEVTATEIKAKSKNFNISFFRDQDKDPESMLTFTNNLSLFDGKAVGPTEGILFNGKYDFGNEKSPLIKTNYLGMFFPTSSGDFYGLQVKNDLNVLKKLKLDSYVRFSYTEKIVEYLYDEGDKENPDNGRALYSVDAGLRFKPLPIWNTEMKAEYATRRSPGIEDIESSQDDGYVKSRDAVYLYTANTFKLGLLGTIKANVGVYNAGEYFDIAGLGTNSTHVFRETDVIDMETDKKAYMAFASYDLFSKGFLIGEATYASYGSNAAFTVPEEFMRGDIIFNAIPGKLRVEGRYQLEKDDRDGTDTEITVDEIAAGELETEDGLETLQTSMKINLIKGMEQNVRLALIDNLDEDNEDDTENQIEAYFDNVITMGNVEIKMGALYEHEGLDQSEIDEDEGVISYPVDDEKKSLDTGMNIQISGENNLFTLGFRYNYEDVVGNVSRGTDKEDDLEGYSASASHEIELGKLTLTYGGKYEIEKEYVDGSEDLKDIDDTDDIVYAVGLEYDFEDDVVASFTYGDPSLTNPDDMTEANFILRKTAFAEGEQDRMTLSIEAKF